ncbi:MAG: M23 family metallopeptidase [Anaerolineales bacterium]|nr:M23 family metallopeptidase [Anaerolineales bacterium]
MDQPIFRIMAFTLTLLIKSITAFIGFILIALLLLQPSSGTTPQQASIDVLEEVMAIAEPVLELIQENTAEDPQAQEGDTSGTEEVAPALSYESYEDPAGCLDPGSNYELVEVNSWEINSRTRGMLEYAEQIFNGTIELTGVNLIHGSYDDRAVMADTPFSGGGAVGISITDPATGEVLTTDLQALIDSLRTAGFAAWLRGVNEVYPGSPMMIEAIAIGDQDLNDKATARLFAEYGYFSMKNGLPGEETKPDSHGGPVVCRWMLEAGIGGTALETELSTEMTGSTFEDESHAAQLDPDSVNREARQLRIVPEPLAFTVTGYDGPTSFSCIAPSDQSVISGLFGEVRGEFIHAGIDYAQCSREGFAVYTPMGGEVTFAGYHELYGYLVIVENDGWQVLMAHNLADLVGPGDIVEAGQVVALSGSSGNSGGPHVHFEIRYCEDGVQCRPMNPSEVLLPGQSELCKWEELGQLECPPDF